MAQQSLSRKTVIEKLFGEFELLFDFIVLCIKLPMPSYLENLELVVLAEEMINLEMPTDNQWKVIENYTRMNTGCTNEDMLKLRSKPKI